MAKSSKEKRKPILVVMGVSGCGKTSIGQGVATALDLPFYDADDFHPKANIEKMAAGFPLDDSDRLPWLQVLARKIDTWAEEKGAVLACSALKERYRMILSNQNPSSIDWIYLSGSEALIRSRMEQRAGHYMKADLLHSQLFALEIPTYGLHVDIDASSEQVVERILFGLF